jgi:hypothetical protein
VLRFTLVSQSLLARALPSHPHDVQIQNMEIVLWTIAILAVLGGLLGTVIPALPGAPLIFGGVLLAAWLDDFTKIGGISLTVLGLLALLTFAIDIFSPLVGAKRVGASRQALIGAVIGSVIGIAFGLIGILVAPFLGAFIGELMSGARPMQAGKVGVGTWIGMVVGTALKVGVALSMVGVFVFALVW